jgi:hypothetical protein
MEIERCGANVTGRGRGSMAGQPDGIPTVEPMNRPNQVVVVCSVCPVQLRALSVAADEPPGATDGGTKANDVICTVPEQIVGPIDAAEALVVPAASRLAARTSDATAHPTHLRMAPSQCPKQNAVAAWRTLAAVGSVPVAGRTAKSRSRLVRDIDKLLFISSP